MARCNLIELTTEDALKILLNNNIVQVACVQVNGPKHVRFVFHHVSHRKKKKKMRVRGKILLDVSPTGADDFLEFIFYIFKELGH